ncbi:MAG TPA: hypothetical protein QGF58_00275 [Myxococcota bacterium]|nr:hypothetical protein [Myxococcota bacterium]
MRWGRGSSLLVAALAALLLAVAVSWPLALHLDTHLLSPAQHPDVQVGGLFWPKAVAHSVLSLEDPFFRKELACPLGQDVTLVTWNLALQVLLIPITSWASPVAALNLSALAIAVLNGLAFAWAGWRFSGDWRGGAWALVLGTCAAGPLSEVGLGHMDQAFLAPQAVFFVALATRRRALATVALALAGAVYWFNALFLLVLALVLLLAIRRKELLVDLATIGGAALLFILPLLIPVLLARWEQPEVLALVEDPGPVRQLRETYSLALSSFLGPLPSVDLARPHHLRPSLLALPLLAVGAWKLRGQGRALSAAGLVAMVLALGPRIFLAPGMPLIPGPAALLHLLPGFEQLRWPARWALQALPLLAAVGGAMLARRPRLLVGLVVVLVIEARVVRSASPELAPFGVNPALMELEGPVVQVPSASLPNGFVGLQAMHGQPIDGGIGFQFPEMVRLHDRDVELLAAIDAIGMHETPDPDPDWGPFRHVALYPVGPKEQQRHWESDLKRLLGPPLHESRDLMLWTK